MHVLLFLNSSSSLINISKSYKHHHNLLLSNSQQRQPRTVHFSVSCEATKSVSINHKLDDEDGNLYKILSLSPKTATTDEIKRAYRTMALRYHPDVCRDGLKKDESTRMFVRLNEAYKILSNPKLKEEYDSKLLGLDDMRRSKWMEQVVELNRRSHQRKGCESWGGRMRAKKNMNKVHQNI